MEIRWPIHLGGLYGRVVTRVIQLNEFQNQWQDAVNALKQVNIFSRRSEHKANHKQWLSYQFGHRRRLCYLLAGFLLWQSDGIPVDTTERHKAMLALHQDIQNAVKDAMQRPKTLAHAKTYFSIDWCSVKEIFTPRTQSSR